MNFRRFSFGNSPKMHPIWRAQASSVLKMNKFGAKLSQKFWVKIFLIITNNVITFVFILTAAGGWFAPDGEIGVCGATWWAHWCTMLYKLVHTLAHSLVHTTHTLGAPLGALHAVPSGAGRCHYLTHGISWVVRRGMQVYAS